MSEPDYYGEQTEPVEPAEPVEPEPADPPPDDDESMFDDDTPLACGLENPEVCESCQ